jgi:hypothetical protein
MNYHVSDIPYSQFEKLGMSKKDVQNTLSFEDLDKLLKGEKTDLKTIPIQTQDKLLNMDMKFSLRRNKDNSIQLMLHPKRQQIDTKFDLTKQEQTRLEQGEAVLKKGNSNMDYLYQMDRDTKEIMRIQQSKIFVPDHIEDIQLSQAQKEKLRIGETIELEKHDKKLNVKLDLNKPQLFKTHVSYSIKTNHTPQYKR